MITENYIKTCEMAEEIQKVWKPKAYDYYRQVSYQKIDKKTSRITNRLDELYLFNKKTNNNLFNIKRFWLPTQEQLQVMVDWESVGRDDIVGELNELASDLFSTDDPVSWNEFWLMIVMCKKYHKTWDGKVWEITSYWQD